MNILAKDANPWVMSDVLSSYFTFPFVHRLFLKPGYLSRFLSRILVLSLQLYFPLLLSVILFFNLSLGPIKKNTIQKEYGFEFSIYGRNTNTFKNREQI
jgi:flagellar biosynthesis protein FliR